MACRTFRAACSQSDLVFADKILQLEKIAAGFDVTNDINSLKEVKLDTCMHVTSKQKEKHHSQASLLSPCPAVTVTRSRVTFCKHAWHNPHLTAMSSPPLRLPAPHQSH